MLTNLHDLSGFSVGLKKCVDNLAKWGKSVFRQIPKKIQEKKAMLDELLKNETARQNGAMVKRGIL